MEVDNPRRLLPWILTIDAVITVPAVVALVVNELASFAAALAVMGLRALIGVLVLERLLAPVQQWRATSHHAQAGHAHALALADRSLHAAAPRFIPIYACTWSLSFLLITITSPTPMSAGQEVTASFVAVSIMLASVLLFPVFRSVLGPLHVHVAEAMMAQGITPVRPRVPLISSIVAMFLSLMLAVMIGVFGVALGIRSQAQVQQALAEQRRLAELDAQQLALTGALSPASEASGATITTIAQLPDADPSQTRSSHAPNLELVSAAAPVGDGRFVVREAEFDDDTWPLAVLAAFAAVLCIVPSILAGFALNRVLLAPLRALELAARSVAEQGKLRAQVRIVAPFDDEIGDVGHSFNAMLDVLEQIAAVAAAVTEGNLQVELDGPGDLQDSFRVMVSRLDQVVAQIRMTALELASAAAEIHAATQEQERASEQQSVAIRQIGSTVGSLASSADAISSAAKGVLSNAEQTRVTTEDTAGRIIELESQTQGITELLGLIRDIANRSDLLALNGSLEAVRAGEAGRGFALVAAEMRRLAERVSVSIEDVAAQLDRIQSTSTAAVLAMAHSHDLAQSTAGVAHQISTETEHQSDATSQLAQAVAAVTEVAIATTRATGHTRATAESLEAHAMQLERLTAKFKTRGA